MRGPERVLCLFTSLLPCPSPLPFCNISVLSAPSVCLRAGESDSLGNRNISLFEAKEALPIPALLRNEVVLTFSKICDSINQILGPFLENQVPRTVGFKVKGWR